MGERFNGHIEEALQSHHFKSGKNWKRRCTAMPGYPTNSFRNHPSAASRH
jgi:hypothetical protein